MSYMLHDLTSST